MSTNNEVTKLISVTIPVYKPDLAFFRQTLTSVLNNGVEPELLELTVVNDYNGHDGVAEVVEEYSDLIKYHQNPISLGIAGNWNRCVALASCKWVHILHQDDLVLPGFYQTLIDADQKQNVKAFASRYFDINEFGNITSVSHLEQQSAGFLDSAADRIVRTNTIQCVSIAVTKEIYSSIGGFNPSLSYVLDWEMWFRVSLRCPIWYVPTPLACFRKHSSSETPRAKQTGASARDMIKGAAIVANYAPEYAARAREYGARHIISTATDFLINRSWRQGAYQLRVAPTCFPQVLKWQEYWSCWLWVIRIVIRNVLNFRLGVEALR